MRHIIIILERILDAQLHLHLPQAAPALLLAVEEAPLPDGDHGVVIVELERIEVQKLQQQLAHRHRVLLREPTQQIQVLRAVEIGVVHGLLVVLDGDLRAARVPRDWSAVPVGREFLENGEERRADGALEEVDEHEDVSVGAERLVSGVVDVVGLRPAVKRAPKANHFLTMRPRMRTRGSMEE